MTTPIERYLAALARRLPSRQRDRILAEAEDHLREAARESGEEAAVVRFGSPDEVARRFAAQAASPSARRAALALTVALGLAFLALYPIPENTLPPAPWPGDRPPDYLHWKQDRVAQLFLLAMLAAGGALAAALFGRLRIALALVAAAIGSLAAMAALGAILAYQWQQAVPGSPGPIWIGLYLAVQASLLATAALLVLRAHAFVRG